MTKQIDLVAEFREDSGKGSSRRLRHAGKVPAIIYGAGREPRSLTFDHNALLRAVENESFFSSVLNVQVGENIRKSILKDIQIHPARRQILHLDLQRIVEDEKIRMTISLRFLNEEVAPGVKISGGIVSHMRTDVEISCFPADLPEYLEVDVGQLELDELLHLSDVVLPDGVELMDLMADPPRDDAIASIHMPRVEAEEEPEAEGEEGEGEGEGEDGSSEGEAPADSDGASENSDDNSDG
ncbi:MAG: 50S ribosomal protein L25/general stress protein Ctc [Pseudomonadota bacterium]|nr:50S ribosomal protein L25/general stress protein Ctc [Pseudomonadota bacterium]